MRLLPLLGALASAAAYAPNWGEGGDPFNDGVDAAPVQSSWRTDLNVTIDCPKWSRVSTIVGDTVLLTCGPAGDDERGSIRRYSLEDGTELARLDGIDARWPALEVGGHVYAANSKMGAFQDAGQGHLLYKLDAASLEVVATRDVSPDLGLLDSDGNADASSQLNGILSVATLEDDDECDGARMAVGISGYGLSYGVGSDPHQAAHANRNAHYYGKIAAYCSSTLEPIWVHRNGMFADSGDLEVGDPIPDAAFRDGHRWRALLREFACDGPVDTTNAIPEEIAVGAEASAAWPAVVAVDSGEDGFGAPSVWAVREAPEAGGGAATARLAPDGANWNYFAPGAKVRDPATGEAVGTLQQIVDVTLATHAVTEANVRGAKTFLKVERREWSGPPGAAADFGEGACFEGFPPSLKVRVGRGDAITDTSARAALQSWGGSFWFRMASDGASLVTPSGDASTESLDQWYAMRATHEALADHDRAIFEAVIAAQVTPDEDHIAEAARLQTDRALVLKGKQSIMDALAASDSMMAADAIVRLDWRTGKRGDAVFADGPETDANNALILPSGDVVATTKAGTLMVVRDGEIVHTLLLGEMSGDSKGVDSPGNFGGLCYPGTGDVVAMHSGVQTRTMIVHDQLVRAGHAFVVGVNAKTGETAWVHVKPKGERAWAVGLTCDDGLVFVSEPLSQRVVGLDAGTGREVWSAPAPGCDGKYNCVEVAHANGRRYLITDHNIVRFSPALEAPVDDDKDDARDDTGDVPTQAAAAPDDNLKEELAAAEQKIADLESEVERLTDMTTGIANNDADGSAGVALEGKSIAVIGSAIVALLCLF